MSKIQLNFLKESYEPGINFFDTVHKYTPSEEILGKGFKGIRDKVCICTKSESTERKEHIKELTLNLKKLKTE